MNLCDLIILHIESHVFLLIDQDRNNVSLLKIEDIEASRIRQLPFCDPASDGKRQGVDPGLSASRIL